MRTCAMRTCAMRTMRTCATLRCGCGACRTQAWKPTASRSRSQAPRLLAPWLLAPGSGRHRAPHRTYYAKGGTGNEQNALPASLYYTFRFTAPSPALSSSTFQHLSGSHRHQAPRIFLLGETLPGCCTTGVW